MSGPQLDFFAVRRYTGEKWEDLSDAVAVEEPLELRVGTAAESVPLSVMMRTPGHDLELVRGWLHAEGLLGAVSTISVLPGAPNVLLLEGDTATLLAAQRGSVTSSACGVCGSGSVERLMLRVAAPVWTAPPLSPAVIRKLPELLRTAQPAFQASGGLHAAGVFEASGRLLHAFEDVGRHNAVDKVVGAALTQLPLSNRVLVTSSRAGFEIVQKALLAGVAVVVTVGAPSSLAVETAISLGLTLVGFVRGERFNVYAGAERLNLG
ncbi:formate dehydrogenase accessory sulfurtransferase FdhD [Deinococcus ruber]|uniref:Sulfur carrier protein FdhD n=1 Tax=Deinococcus ruber TaxID=1848197 RepID=A0A918F1L1_9DEIO|nr:formate dehydrogenase accessory sulfurtransferase FdhD [Deinococcus ruber]GGQ99086.1 sulfurtransferase FdhD [Deinococcus ruber]